MKNRLRVLQTERASSHGELSRRLVASHQFSGVEILLVLRTTANLRLRRAGDESMYSLMHNICALTFAIRQGLLTLYETANHRNLVPEVSSWDATTVPLTLFRSVGGMISLRQQRSSVCIGAASLFKESRAC